MFVRKSSSHRRCSVRKGVLINYTKFRRKHLCQSLRPATILKKRGWCSCFRVIFAKFLRTTFLQNTSGRLLLNLSLRCWFSEAAVLKNFAILRPLSDNKVADLRLTPTLATSEFLLQQFFFFFLQLKMVLISDSCRGFCSGPLWKSEINLRSRHRNCSVKRCTKKISKFYKKRPALKSLFNGVGDL